MFSMRLAHAQKPKTNMTDFRPINVRVLLGLAEPRGSFFVCSTLTPFFEEAPTLRDWQRLGHMHQQSVAHTQPFNIEWGPVPVHNTIMLDECHAYYDSKEEYTQLSNSS